MLDGVWSAFLASHYLADEVRIGSRNAILDCGCAFWIQSEGLDTTRCVVFFNRELGVPIVNSSFTYCRDVFPLTLAVRWDIDVAHFDLVLEQSQAAFAFAELMRRSENWRSFISRVASPSGAAAPSHAAGAAHTPASEESMEPVLPHKYAMTNANVRALRKQARSSKWAIGLGSLVERYVDATIDDAPDPEVPDVSITSAAMGLLEAAQDSWVSFSKHKEHKPFLETSTG